MNKTRKVLLCKWSQ